MLTLLCTGEIFMMTTKTHTSRIYTVSHLTREIKTLLEERFPFVWVSGEISNYAVPASGHSYFSLKDAKAVINCAMFKGQKRMLKFRPENGMKVMGMARLSLYEPRGSYQLIFEHMEPEGAGSLQVAFEQLKEKLSAQGLFDSSRKKALPFFPRKIHVITSGTGAAVKDIMHIAGRRAPYCHLEIIPVKVQGDGSADEIVQALKLANQRKDSDVIILARGGGSLEDLESFNSEAVAMAIAASKIPVVTGVGHETDFTIADFVSDLRAPTPSGAAEIALPDAAELRHRISQTESRLTRAMTHRMIVLQQRLDDLYSRLKSPRQVMESQRRRIKELTGRMEGAMEMRLGHSRERVQWLSEGLKTHAPATDKQAIQYALAQLHIHMKHRLTQWENRVDSAKNNLEALSPKAILNRGYGMVRTLPDQDLVTDHGQVKIDDRVEIILSKGRLETRVEKINNA